MMYRLLAVGVVLAIIAAYVYSRRPVAPLTTGEPEPWPNPPGTDMPNPTMVANYRPTEWRGRVIDAANALYLAALSVNSAGGSIVPPRSTFVIRMKDESGYGTRAHLKALMMAVRPYDIGLARNGQVALSYQAFNMARDNMNRALDTLDAYVQPFMPMVASA